jgi:hypothetical protein
MYPMKATLNLLTALLLAPLAVLHAADPAPKPPMPAQPAILTSPARSHVTITQVTQPGGEHIDRFPALWRRKDGSLLLIYQEITGKNRFKGEGCHVLMAATDEGKTWREERRALPWTKGVENASAGRAESPGDYCRFSGLPDGRLVYHGQSADGGLLYLSKEEFRDEPAAWQMVRASYPADRADRPTKGTCFYHLRVLRDGSWAIFATWQQRFEDREKDPKAAAQDYRRGLNRGGLDFLISRDEGRTWSVRSTLYEGTWFPYLLCEPSWAIGADGVFRVFTREDMGHGPGVEFRSSDQGRTWTAAPMRFMGHHIYAEHLPGGKGLLACYRVPHYIHFPAVGAWWDDGSPWGRFLHLDNVSTSNRYQADMSQWVAMPDGTFICAYSLPPASGQEVRVRVARFSLEAFAAPGVSTASR